jgi:hypothetical protein
MENYLAEVARVLKVGGRCVATFFLHNREAARLSAQGKAQLRFVPTWRGFWTANPRAPEDAICFDERRVRQQYERNGLEIDGPVHFGGWCGRTGTLSWQDVIVARKAVAGRSAHPRRPLVRQLSRRVFGLLHGPLQKLYWKSTTYAAVARARGTGERARPAA